MDTPASIDWAADRYVPFIRTMAFVDFDFTGATFAMQVRDRKDGGAVRADLATVTTASAEGVRLIYGGTDTVANHIAAGRLTQEQADARGYTSGQSLEMSQVGIRINETTMEAMPFAAEIGDDRTEYWDIQITPLGGTKDVYARGKFIVRAGVTA